MGDHVSMFDLEEWQEFLRLPKVRVVKFDQCMLGAETPKPTMVVYWGMDLSGLEGRCNHEPQRWEYTDLNGKVRYAWRPHAPLQGRRRQGSEMATAAASAYPSGMNRAIAEEVKSHSDQAVWGG